MAKTTPEATESGSAGSPSMVDWDLAVTTAKRLMKPGPDVDKDEAAAVVADLRRFAALSEGHVRGYTLLDSESATAPVVVVDRGGWVQANVDGLRYVIEPLIEKLRTSNDQPGSFATAIGSRLTGLEAGGLFAYLSNKVLGQFDPFFTGPVPAVGSHVSPARASYGGRLLLVAPNIMAVERELRVDPADFRLWVCLHEETHRVQFTAVPWLRTYLLGQIELLLDKTDLDPGRLSEMLRETFEQVGKLVRGNADVSLIDILRTPEQKAVIERVTAVMSLLEGHADVVMDGVGPSVVASVADIRSKFNARRAGAGALDQMIRKLLGFDAKLRQYRDGAVFVRGVIDKVGMAGFNAVWAEPANLPSKDEIADPASWVTRVHG